MDTIPWVEKYRPSSFNDIVLDSYNKVILSNILDENDIPNMLLYGPPGTGKTTTIINLIEEYKRRNNIKNNDIVIHLNASDDRGIEIIRNNILQFVSSSALFKNHLKFVILDEVDYMTKNAQQALKYILSSFNKNIRYILMCNYISKIDTSLQDRLLKLQFNQLPRENITSFLCDVCKKERINVKEHVLYNIQNMFRSDVRSMINYLQCNKNTFKKNNAIISNKVFQNLVERIVNDNQKSFNEYIYLYSVKFNIDRIELIHQLVSYIITNYVDSMSNTLLQKIQFIMHNKLYNIEHITNYIYYNCKGSLESAFST